MISGLSGSLLSHDALARAVPTTFRGLLDESRLRAARARLRGWHVPLRRQLGPSTSARGCFDRLAAPLFTQLGYRVLPSTASEGTFRALLTAEGQPSAALIVTAWGQDASRVWREAVRHGIAHGVSWCFCVTGPMLRVIDTRRTYSRRYAELSLDAAFDDEPTFAVLWGLFRAAAMRPDGPDPTPLIERAITVSEEHRGLVRSSLQQGVEEALGHLIGAFVAAGTRRAPARRETPREVPIEPARALDESLIVIYRILFLLFAEARGMVPRWHPMFRDAYTIESVRIPVERLPRPRGLWETLQAITRLAHCGCQIGALRVTAFNGRLFSPTHSPLSDTLPLDDGEVRQAVLALTTRPATQGRVPISYGDLGVEQLGGIYERILDYEPPLPGPRADRRPSRSGRRKATGSFYTPRSVADYLVRRTLAPLVRDASPDAILHLRVLDPAMGSAAFLVSACRFLAGAYETALLREGAVTSEDITDVERAGFRRAIAQQCLFGVDVNPMAVQVGRLSLWLATLAADRPLTFLDHRLRTGNSLVGAGVIDITRPPPVPGKRRHLVDLPLFAARALDATLCEAVEVRRQIAFAPGDTLEQVRSKEQALGELSRAGSGLASLKAIADLWCSPWFADARSSVALKTAFAALTDEILGRGAQLPPHSSAQLRDQVRSARSDHGFFHWSLEFPEVFFDGEGRELANPGFDAIVGNPPWEMLRGDQGDTATRAAARSSGSRLKNFARASGVYRLQGEGHANLYQLFVERAATLLRREGRLGFVLPSGFAVDHGSASLRRATLDGMCVDALVSVENRDGVFPIHRGLKFLLLSATKSPSTRMIPCRFGIRSPADLDRLPDTGTDGDTIGLARELVERFGGSSLAIPEVRTPGDLEIVTRIVFGIPAFGDAKGWNLHFGRELNATDDRRHFLDGVSHGLPVIEGKHIRPFSVDVGAVRYRIARSTAARLLQPERTFGRARLAYRDVASSSNRLSLIATIVPAGSVTTHTLYCLKETVAEPAQQYLCGIFNSFVANYLVRLRITTHVGAAVIDRLPVPNPAASDPTRREIAALAAKLSRGSDPDASARLQAAAAYLYGLGGQQFAKVLESFPLVPRSERDAARSAFCDIFDHRQG